jgi:NTE family protein
MATDPLLIDLALQGGGSHGAFTWGVLDRLLEEDWLHIAAISGTSAGAMKRRRAGRRLDGGGSGGRASGAHEILTAGVVRRRRSVRCSALRSIV